MENKEYLQKLHGEILIIMDEIDRICKKNGLRYYLIGGTLLGAIRHGGFIPWDDDLDIVMPREDLDKLIKISKEELDPEFKLEWYGSNEGYYQYFPKISKRGTLFVQEGIKESKQSGIFVDIFPLDLAPAYTPWLDKEKHTIIKYSEILTSWNCNRKGLGYKLFRVIRLFTPKRIFLWLISKELNRIKSKGQTHYANFGSQYKIQKQTMPVEWFGEGTKMQFEDRSYICPSKYEQVLNSIFGPTYMELPPIEKRRTHYPDKVVFSDGSVFISDENIHKVTLSEQEG